MAKKKERWISLPHASRVTRIPMQRLDRMVLEAVKKGVK